MGGEVRGEFGSYKLQVTGYFNLTITSLRSFLLVFVKTKFPVLTAAF
jgi:hypothetical protein